MSRFISGKRGRELLVLSLLGSASGAFAQVTPPAEPPAEAPVAAPAAGTRTYTPADFERFTPRNALDMLNNVPGFAIDEADTERRGLGQATGNVLINGERFSGKSTDIFTELRRISAANVARIEVVDGSTLNIPGLSGQVANVITLSRGLSGNFIWRPQIRAHRTPARLTNGEVSINGSLSGTDYTLSLRNNSYRNGNAGPEEVTTPLGAILDRRDEVLSVYGEEVRLSGTLHRGFGNGSVLNLNMLFGVTPQDLEEVSLRSGPGQPDRNRNLAERRRQHNYELGGDYELGLLGGRLKLIGVTRGTHTDFRQTLIQIFADTTPTEGQRFTQLADETETIGRGEFRWRGGGADWQASLEGVLNRLDVVNALYTRDAGGDFINVPFPDSAATVEEQRAEAGLTYGRALTPKLSLQASLGGEYSQLTQSGPSGLSRTFYRPKGYLNLAWRPRTGLDVSARIERVVGQLNFFDFVASGNVSSGTQNAGNANLVPPQSWDAHIEASRNLGRWGTATAKVYGRLISDIVDIIPVNGGQSPGNLPGNATVLGLQWTSTFNLDPIGVPGAKIDMNLQFQQTRLTDPLTGERRSINENMTRQIDISFRHDIPRTDWAYGGGFFQYRQSPLYRLDQRWAFLDTPGSLGAFVEHKDVFGLTVRASVDNLLGTNESFTRTFYNGLRTNGELATEARDRFYGPVFSLTITGTI
jgi:outer membrane receptor for ferrienterochelin and colicins